MLTDDPAVLARQVSEDFIRGMRNRMLTSYYRYGDVADAYPAKVNALESLMLRLFTYQKTRNTEYLIDAANFAMIEFMHPSLPDAFFRATDSDGSPGRLERGNPTPVPYANRDLLPTDDELTPSPDDAREPAPADAEVIRIAAKLSTGPFAKVESPLVLDIVRAALAESRGPLIEAIVSLDAPGEGPYHVAPVGDGWVVRNVDDDPFAFTREQAVAVCAALNALARLPREGR